MHAAKQIFDVIMRNMNQRLWKGLTVQRCTYQDDVLYFPFSKPPRLKTLFKWVDADSYVEKGKGDGTIVFKVDGEMYGLVFGCESQFERNFAFDLLGEFNYANPVDSDLHDYFSLESIVLDVLKGEGIEGKTGDLGGKQVSFKSARMIPLWPRRADMFVYFVKHYAEALNYTFDEKEVIGIVKKNLQLEQNPRRLSTVSVAVTSHNKAMNESAESGDEGWESLVLDEIRSVTE